MKRCLWTQCAQQSERYSRLYHDKDWNQSRQNLLFSRTL
jgi:hypothetical protein